MRKISDVPIAKGRVRPGAGPPIVRSQWPYSADHLYMDGCWPRKQALESPPEAPHLPTISKYDNPPRNSPLPYWPLWCRCNHPGLPRCHHPSLMLPLRVASQWLPSYWSESSLALTSCQNATRRLGSVAPRTPPGQVLPTPRGRMGDRNSISPFFARTMIPFSSKPVTLLEGPKTREDSTWGSGNRTAHMVSLPATGRVEGSLPHGLRRRFEGERLEFMIRSLCQQTTDMLCRT